MKAKAIVTGALPYLNSGLRKDFVAGLSVSALLVPQSVAYALLAGLPPEVGLYSALLPPVVYGLLGSSRYLSVGPVALDSLLVGASLSLLSHKHGVSALAIAPMFCAVVGMVQLCLGLLHGGFLANSFPGRSYEALRVRLL
ncbi:MAG: hypothetical protein IPJ88_15850 [Myxococcales bacterium]|nr:MAG: hypothetical protein IPJ88_15850 [Myxococcales bacterium]